MLISAVPIKSAYCSAWNTLFDRYLNERANGRSYIHLICSSPVVKTNDAKGLRFLSQKFESKILATTARDADNWENFDLFC